MPTTNPVPSTDPSDLVFNAGAFDRVVNSAEAAFTDRLGISRKTVAGAIATISAITERGAWVPSTAYSVKDLVVSSGTWYICVVAHIASASFSTDSAKWRVYQGVIAEDLAATTGSSLVGYDGGTVQDVLDIASRQTGLKTVAELLASTKPGLGVGSVWGAAGYLYKEAPPSAVDHHIITAAGVKLYEYWPDRTQVGDTYFTGASRRDAFVASRTVDGLTDSHAFADRSILQNVSDPGTYASFDTIAKLDGAHNQDHFYGYQGRLEYRGTGLLQRFASFWSSLKFSGPGTINEVNQIEVRDVASTGGGTINSHIGLFIRDLVTGTTKSAIAILQSTGFAIYAAGGARSYLKGNLAIGPQDINPGVPIAVTSDITHNYAFAATNIDGAIFGVQGDKSIQFLTNGGARWEISVSGTGYVFRPMSNNTSDIGSTTRRVKALYATTLKPGDGTVTWTSGAGSPEGVVGAVIGSMYTRTDGGANTTLYVKESGVGNSNTGWVAK